MKIVRKGFGIICAVSAAFIALLVHTILPSPGATTDPGSFNSYLVQYIGFPLVASLYFVILYLHILIVMWVFGKNAQCSKIQIGIRYGVAFGLMYLIGMQEVMVEYSSLSEYGIPFVQYQFFMGLGDAIPVFLLSIVIALCILEHKPVSEKLYTEKNRDCKILLISFAFFGVRIVCYYTGFIDSDIHQYPIPVIVWTVIMAITFAVINLLLNPIYQNVNLISKSININFWTIGINWIWFNCFMGLIFKGLFIKMILRGMADIIAIMLGYIIANIIMKNYGLKNKISE